MTRTAEKILALFRTHHDVKTGMVLTFSELSFHSGGWEPSDFAGMNDAIGDLKDKGYVIITSSRGLELTEEGLNYLLSE